MPYSVSLWFDEDSETQVRRIWTGLEGAGIESFTAGPIRPHVTLAHGLEVALEPFTTALRAKLKSHPAFKVAFPGLGLFVDSGIVYLSVVMTDVLWTLQREVIQLAREYGGVSSVYYRPNRWTPHCTLAANLTPETMLRAVRACQSVPFPPHAVATRVGIIENPSELELSALPFAIA